MKKITLLLVWFGFISVSFVSGQESDSVSTVNPLQETLSTALGIERKVTSVPYAAQQIRTDEFPLARELNAINSLSGKIAGISILRSSRGLGAPSRVSLRGNRSFAGESQPLYVLDGVPILRIPEHLNPDDIASLTALKGANAAALYGNRAQNGALLITTKNGEGDYRVNLSTTYLAYMPNLLLDYQEEYGQGSEGSYWSTSPSAWGSPLDGQKVKHWSPDPAYTDSTYNYLSYDPVSDFFQTGHNWTHNLSIRGGTNKTQTYFSYTYTDASSVIPNHFLSRHNVHLRTTRRLANKWSLDTKITYIREDIDNALKEGDRFDNPLRFAYFIPPNIRPKDYRQFEYTDHEGTNRQNSFYPGSHIGANPYWIINRNLNQHASDRVLGFASLTYQLFDGLSLQLRSGLDRLMRKTEERYYNDSYIVAYNGNFSVERVEAFEWNSDLLISWQKKWGRNWLFNFHTGANIRKERGTTLAANTGSPLWGLNVPNLFSLSNTQQVQANYKIGEPRDVHSIYGLANLGWKEAIFLDLTARNDWSSSLPPQTWSQLYPSVGVNAIISRLLDLPDWLSFASLRGSWAQVGNDLPSFLMDRTFVYELGGPNGFLNMSTTIPNLKLKPEQTRSTEIGTRLTLLNHRLDVDFTWYQANTRDQLVFLPLPVGAGAENRMVNGGNVRNRGVEMILRILPFRTRNFEWEMQFSYARNRNQVLEIHPELTEIRLVGGRVVDYMLKAGQAWGQLDSWGVRRNKLGSVIVDRHGYPLFSVGRNVTVANMQPDWLGGIWNRLSFGPLSLSFLVDIRKGGSFISMTNMIATGRGLTGETLEGRKEGVVFGKTVFADETAVQENGSSANITVDAETFWRTISGCCAPLGEVWARDASNIRLRETVLSYQPAWAASGFLRQIRLSLVGRNLFFISNASRVVDPEMVVGTGVGAEGIEAFSPPPTRSLGVQIEVEF